MSEIGIVIVTHNSAAEIGECLDAAARTGARLLVVDNASTDDTVTQVNRRGVELIANPTNRGFAAAVNQGFVVLNCTHVLLLNPDAAIISDLEPLRAACDQPRAAGAGGKLLDPEGHPQTGFMARQLPTPTTLILESLLLNRLFPNNPANRKYRGLKLDYTGRIEVEQPAGAFLMIRRDVWRELGGFDELFHPLWFEDVDFCRRAIDRGYRFFFEPTAVAKHTGAHSVSTLSVEMRRVYWYRSLLKYTAKHFSPIAFRAVCFAVAAGSVLRAIAQSASRLSFKPTAGFGEVVRLAWSGLMSGPGAIRS